MGNLDTLYDMLLWSILNDFSIWLVWLCLSINIYFVLLELLVINNTICVIFPELHQEALFRSSVSNCLCRKKKKKSTKET